VSAGKLSTPETWARDTGTAVTLSVFGRPFVKRFALCYGTVVLLSVLSLLSVMFVYCGQMVDGSFQSNPIQYVLTGAGSPLGNWTTRGYANSQIANSRTGYLADWSTRGLDNSRTCQLADWTSRVLDNSRCRRCCQKNKN